MVSGSESVVKKRGRPRKKGSKCCGYRLRMTKEEEDRLNWISDKTGLKKSEVIGKALSMYENLVKYQY